MAACSASCAAAAQVASQIPAEDKERAEKAIDDAISWLDANQLGEVRGGRSRCCDRWTPPSMYHAISSVHTQALGHSHHISSGPMRMSVLIYARRWRSSRTSRRSWSPPSSPS